MNNQTKTEREGTFGSSVLVLALAIGAVTRQDLQTLPKGEKLADRLHLR